MPVHNYHEYHIHIMNFDPPTVSIWTKVSYRVCLWGLQERWQLGWHTCQESRLCTETWQHATFCSTKTSLARCVSSSLIPRPRPPFCCLQYVWEEPGNELCVSIIATLQHFTETSMAPEIHDSHSIPDWRFWNGTESDRRYILQVQWRQDSCEVDFPRGKLEKRAEIEGGGVGGRRGREHGE